MNIKDKSIRKATRYSLLTVLVATTLLLGSCTKENSQVRLAPAVASSQLLNVTSSSATVVGFVVAEGDGFTEKGVCYNTSPTPTISNNKVVYSPASGGTARPTATFNVNLTGLTYATKYYARAYATGSAGTVYGDEYSFTTLPVVPTLTTTAITAITGNSATGGGNVTVTGGADITKRGVCFGTDHNPTTANSATADDATNKGTGQYASSLTGLKGNTTYYVRAYAVNSAGTGYGPEISFKTNIDLPVVTTAAVTGITKTDAYSGGEVTYDGGGTVTARGLVWSTNANPTTSDNVVDGGAGTGAFIGQLTGLSMFTTYHVRAFATNSAGTAYGADIQFTTLANTRTWYIPGDYVEASYPGSGLANWSPDKSPTVMSTVSAPDKLEGYVYMANAANQWKFATQPNWNGPNYGDGGGGKLDPNASDNIHSPSGYYKINADATSLTYTAIATTWGLIGNATPGGWGTDTPMNYDPVKSVWHVHATLTKQTPPNDGLKFRANSDWGLNYGDTGADGTLEEGGTNIGVSFDGDYEIILDLSHPNAYKYSLTTWGVIGDATPGGWNTDTPMTWDATNKVWTVTLDLVSGSGSKTFKFRANHDWTLNYGGLGSGDGAADNYTDATTVPLGTSGRNIGVPGNVDGNYTITFNPITLKATVTKN